MGNPFTEATTVRVVGPGRYRSEIDERWNLRPLPQGGIVTALAVRAMKAELGRDDQRPRTLHTTFAARVAREVEIDVDVLREGRSMSHARAEVRNPGEARGQLTTCFLGAPRNGFSSTTWHRRTRSSIPTAVPPFAIPYLRAWRCHSTDAVLDRDRGCQGDPRLSAV